MTPLAFRPLYIPRATPWWCAGGSALDGQSHSLLNKKPTGEPHLPFAAVLRLAHATVVQQAMASFLHPTNNLHPFSPPSRSVSAYIPSGSALSDDPTVASFPLPPATGLRARRRSQTYGMGLGLGLAPAGRAKTTGGVGGPFGRICSAPLAMVSKVSVNEIDPREGLGYLGIERDPVDWFRGGKTMAAQEQDRAGMTMEQSYWSDDEHSEVASIVEYDSDDDELCRAEVQTIDLDLSAFASPSAASASPTFSCIEAALFPKSKQPVHDAPRPVQPTSDDAGLVHPSTPEEYAFLISAIDFSQLPPTSPVSELSSSPMTRSSGVGSPTAHAMAPRKVASAPVLPKISPIMPDRWSLRGRSSVPSICSVAATMSRDHTRTSIKTTQSQSASGSDRDSLFSPALSHASSHTSVISSPPVSEKKSVLGRGRPVPSTGMRVGTFGSQRDQQTPVQIKLKRSVSTLLSDVAKVVPMVVSAPEPVTVPTVAAKRVPEPVLANPPRKSSLAAVVAIVASATAPALATPVEAPTTKPVRPSKPAPTKSKSKSQAPAPAVKPSKPKSTTPTKSSPLKPKSKLAKPVPSSSSAAQAPTKAKVLAFQDLQRRSSGASGASAATVRSQRVTEWLAAENARQGYEPAPAAQVTQGRGQVKSAKVGGTVEHRGGGAGLGTTIKRFFGSEPVDTGKQAPRSKSGRVKDSKTKTKTKSGSHAKKSVKVEKRRQLEDVFEPRSLRTKRSSSIDEILMA